MNLIGYFFAILSSMFFGLYIIPKKLVKVDSKYYLVYMSFGFFVISLLMYIISLFTGKNTENLFSFELLLVCIRGISWLIASNLFLMSIDRIGMVRATQYKNLKGPLGVLFTLIILAEYRVTNVLFVIIAAILTFISAVCFTIKKDNNKSVDMKGILYALFSSLFLAFNAVIQKYITSCGYIYTQQLYQSITIMICSIIWVLFKDKNVLGLKNISLRNKFLACLGGVLYYFATYLNTLSYKYLPASIAFTIINMSGVWSVFVGILIFKEIKFKSNWKRVVLGLFLTIFAIIALLVGKG